jgi:hypothetical protein
MKHRFQTKPKSSALPAVYAVQMVAAGLVSLRVRAMTTAGAYTQVTVYRAYGIG